MNDVAIVKEGWLHKRGERTGLGLGLPSGQGHSLADPCVGGGEAGAGVQLAMSGRLPGPCWRDNHATSRPLSWKAVRTLGPVQGLAHWWPGALPKGS